MKKSVRFLIVAAVSIAAALILRAMATAAGGGITSAGSVLFRLALLAFAVGLVTGVIAVVLAIRGAWRWSRTEKPAAPATPSQPAE